MSGIWRSIGEFHILEYELLETNNFELIHVERRNNKNSNTATTSRIR